MNSTRTNTNMAPTKRTWLKVMRVQRDLTQKQVAQACGLRQTEYSYIEAGRMIPLEDQAKALGAYLGFDWTLFYK